MCFAKRFGTEKVSGNDLEQEVSKLERRTNDDVAVVELPRHQAAAIPPIKQALPTPLGDTVELGSQAAEVRECHRVIVACRSRMCGRRCTPPVDDAMLTFECTKRLSRLRRNGQSA